MRHLLSQNVSVWTCNIIILHDPFKSMGAKVSGAFYYGRMGVSQCKVIHSKYYKQLKEASQQKSLQIKNGLVSGSSFYMHLIQYSNLDFINEFYSIQNVFQPK